MLDKLNTRHRRSPVLLIEEVPSVFPESLRDYLLANENIVWSDEDTDSDLRLRKRDGCWYVELTELSLRGRSSASKRASIAMDFSVLLKETRLQAASLQTELLAKAVLGRKSAQQQPLTVFDLTAGLGRDAMLLAALGCSVVAIERNPLLAFLLQQAHQLALNSAMDALRKAANHISFTAADSVDYLDVCSPVAESTRPDIIYIDPMYAGDGSSDQSAAGLKKTAAVKKDARLLQHMDQIFFAGVEATVSNQAELLESALNYAGLKVVVKRAPKADWLAGRKPSSSVRGKAVRFDVYAR